MMFPKAIQYHNRLLISTRIYADNHPSTLYPFYLLGIVDEPAHTLLTESIFRINGLGFLAHQAGHIRVAHDQKQKALTEAVKTLRLGLSVLIFPEGS